MTCRLSQDKDRPNRPRNELDRQLQVDRWQMPGGAYRLRQPTVDTPGWWRGDEDASQTFLHAMGVVSLK